MRNVENSNMYRVLESRKGYVACFPALNGAEKHAT